MTVRGYNGVSEPLDLRSSAACRLLHHIQIPSGGPFSPSACSGKAMDTLGLIDPSCRGFLSTWACRSDGVWLRRCSPEYSVPHVHAAWDSAPPFWPESTPFEVTNGPAGQQTQDRLGNKGKSVVLQEKQLRNPTARFGRLCGPLSLLPGIRHQTPQISPIFSPVTQRTCRYNLWN